MRYQPNRIGYFAALMAEPLAAGPSAARTEMWPVCAPPVGLNPGAWILEDEDD